MLYLGVIKGYFRVSVSRREVYRSNAQGKHLSTDFSFSKEMFKGLFGIDNVVNFIDILSE